MNKIGLFLSLLLIAGISLLHATDPEVSNVIAAQRTDGSKIVDIWYDLEFAVTDSAFVVLMISEDAGDSFNIINAAAPLTGDIQLVTLPGNGKHIIWNMSVESRMFNSENFVFKVEAYTYAPAPESFVLVEGGTFNKVNYIVTLSSFYMDKFETTQGGYQAVMGINPSSGYGVGSNYPVYRVSWFNAIEYCNRRSMQEGLTPCYGYSTYGTNPDNWPAVWDTNDDNHSNVSCDWTANGYRLPTEMEWEFAARGGNQTHNYTYSGSNTVGDVAWYTYNSGSISHPVGTKIANELGLFDMSGSVFEYCWDIYGGYPSGAQTNPHGAVSGHARVDRGGCYFDYADGCEVSERSLVSATSASYGGGFRCVRVSP